MSKTLLENKPSENNLKRYKPQEKTYCFEVEHFDVKKEVAHERTKQKISSLHLTLYGWFDF